MSSLHYLADAVQRGNGFHPDQNLEYYKVRCTAKFTQLPSFILSDHTNHTLTEGVDKKELYGVVTDTFKHMTRSKLYDCLPYNYENMRELSFRVINKPKGYPKGIELVIKVMSKGQLKIARKVRRKKIIHE